MNTEERIRIKLANPYYWAGLVVVFGVALFTGVPVFWITFWFLALWALFSMLWLIHLAKTMEFFLSLYPREVARIGFVNLELRVINDSFLPLPYAEFHISGLGEKGLIAADEYKPGGGKPAERLDERKEENPPDQFAEIPERKMEFDDNYPLGSWKVSYRLQCFRRGFHSIGPFKVRLYTLFGALAVEKSFSESSKFAVYPRALPFAGRYNVESVEPYGARRNIYSNPYSQLDYTESYDLRPFVPGDPFKLINWKVSARQGEIFVKRPDITSQAKLIIALEFSGKLYPSEEVQDLALEKVFALLTHLITNNYQVGLLTYDGKAHFLPPARGERQLNMLKKLFTGLKQDCEETLLEHVSYNRWSARDRLLWAVPEFSHHYLSGLSRVKQPGQKLSLVVTGENREFGYDSLLNHFYLWQLVYNKNRVQVKRVETSWL